MSSDLQFEYDAATYIKARFYTAQHDLEEDASTIPSEVDGGEGTQYIEVFSPDAFVEGEDDQGCGGDRGDGSGIEGDVREGLEVLDQGVGPLGGSPH